MADRWRTDSGSVAPRYRTRGRWWARKLNRQEGRQMSTRCARRNALTAAVRAIVYWDCSTDRPKEAAMRLKIIVAPALTAIVVGIAAPGAGAAGPADNGNCLS